MPHKSHGRLVAMPAPGPTTRSMDGERMCNEILLALPRKERDAVFRALEFLELRNDVLHKAGEPIAHGYFVNGGLASVLNVMSDGKSVEVGLLGKEGFVGLPLIVGFRTGPTRVVMQVAGSAFRIAASNLAEVLGWCPTLAT